MKQIAVIFFSNPDKIKKLHFVDSKLCLLFLIIFLMGSDMRIHIKSCLNGCLKPGSAGLHCD
jgi:hypothetical protein